MRLRLMRGYKGAGYQFRLEFTKAESPTGKSRFRPCKVFRADSEEDAWRQAEEWRDEFKPAAALGSSRRLSDALVAAIDDRAKIGLIDGPTAYQYRMLVRRYVEPRFGAIDVGELAPYQVVRMYTDLRGGAAPKGHPLSTKTMRQLHSCLSSTYAFMKDVGYVAENPMERVPRPQGSEGARPPVSDADLGKVVQAISAGLADDSTGPANIQARNRSMAMYLMLMMGSRPAEVCALVRSDLNLPSRSVLVAHIIQDVPGAPLVRKRGTKGRRQGKSHVVSIASDACRQIERHLAWQDSYLADSGDSTPIVTCDGSFMRPGDVTRAFRGLADSHGLPPDVTLHSLRHTHAVQLLAHGVSLKEIQARFDHARIATTGDIYANAVIESRDRAGAEAMAAVWAEKGGDDAERD